MGERATVYYYKVSLENNQSPYEIAAKRLHEVWREDRRKQGIQARLEAAHPALAKMGILDIPAGNKRSEIMMDYPESVPFYKDIDLKKPNPRWKPLTEKEHREWFYGSIGSPHHNMCRQKIGADGNNGENSNRQHGRKFRGEIVYVLWIS